MKGRCSFICVWSDCVFWNLYAYVYVHDWIGTIYVVWSGHGTMYSPPCQKMSTRDTRCLHRRTGGRYRCSVPPLWCSLSLFLFVAFKCPPFDLCTAAYCYLFFFLLFWFVQNITIAILYTQRVKRSMNVMLLFALVGYFLSEGSTPFSLKGIT